MPDAGLMAKRVNGEKKHSVSDATRTASLTDLRRWPGDWFFGQNTDGGALSKFLAQRAAAGRRGREASMPGRRRVRYRSLRVSGWRGSNAGQVEASMPGR